MAVERFEPWSQDWPTSSADHLARYLFAAGYAPAKRVLDAGAGYGYGAAILAASGAAQVTAVDIDASVVDKAQKLYCRDNVTFLADDCQELGRVSGPVELICSFENIEHLADPARFVRASARVLSSTGTLICSTPDRAITAPFVNGKPANPYHTHEWYAHEFVALLKEGYEEVELYHQVRAWSHTGREKTVRQFEAFWTFNPAFRLSRWVSRVFGRKTFTPDLGGLCVASPGDYPIYHSRIAPLFGQPWCLVGVCRSPKTQ